MPLNNDKEMTPTETEDIPYIMASGPAFPVIKKKIGGTTYVVTGHQSPTARETAVEKMKRLILNDPGLKSCSEP